jgi:hypothetical protein
MTPRVMARALVLASTVALAAALWRTLQQAIRRGAGDGAPTIGGDTWPPVPTNPDRQG